MHCTGIMLVFYYYYSISFGHHSIKNLKLINKYIRIRVEYSRVFLLPFFPIAFKPLKVSGPILQQCLLFSLNVVERPIQNDSAVFSVEWAFSVSHDKHNTGLVHKFQVLFSLNVVERPIQGESKVFSIEWAFSVSHDKHNTGLYLRSA